MQSVAEVCYLYTMPWDPVKMPPSLQLLHNIYMAAWINMCSQRSEKWKCALLNMAAFYTTT